EPQTQACTRPASPTRPVTMADGYRFRTKSAADPAYRTSPAGPAEAPATDSTAAPGQVAEPVASPTTPRAYLSDSRPARGHQARTSSRSASRRHGSTAGDSPMSTRSTSPARPAPSPTSRPGFRQPKVTVTSASTASPGTAPVSASTPDGRSTATTAGR